MIRVTDLAKSFGEVQALKGVSFEVPQGQICGYLGPNGAGKSTTVKLLCGMIKADEGTASVGGFDIVQDPIEVKRRLGYVPESGALYESLTPQEYLLLVGRLHGMADDEIERRARKFLELFKLLENFHDRMSGFSKGMKQKVVLTAAFLHDPEVLFLDEPLGGLDANMAYLIKQLLRQYADEGKTILYSSHILEVVERICDRVIILNEGELIADGSMEQLRQRSGDSTLEAIFKHLTTDEEASQVAEGFLQALRQAEPSNVLDSSNNHEP